MSGAVVELHAGMRVLSHFISTLKYLGGRTATTTTSRPQQNFLSMCLAFSTKHYRARTPRVYAHCRSEGHSIVWYPAYCQPLLTLVNNWNMKQPIVFLEQYLSGTPV